MIHNLVCVTLAINVGGYYGRGQSTLYIVALTPTTTLKCSSKRHDFAHIHYNMFKLVKARQHPPTHHITHRCPKANVKCSGRSAVA